jgi:hypothetical protein
VGFDLVDLLKKYNGDYSELEILLALRSIVRGWSGYQEIQDLLLQMEECKQLQARLIIKCDR